MFSAGQSLFGSLFIFLLALQALTLPYAVGAEEANVLARIHFNTQTSDFQRTREFYRLLGYTEGISDYPKTNTHAMARSLGMYDLCTYEIENIEVMSIPNSLGPTSIDLIQFDVPFNSEPPYTGANHLGLAYAALGSPSFEADYNYLRGQGVNFLSEPVGEIGSRFAFMQDPDGVYLKLVESLDSRDSSNGNGSQTRINSMPHVGINVRNFSESLNFYQSLGYTNIEMLPENGSLAEGIAFGLDQPFTLRGADISLVNGDGHTLRLVQWLEPFNPEPPYPPPINHIGIHRIALAVQNLDAAVSSLSAQGVQFLSDIAPCCSGTSLDEMGIINAIDPDGIFVELVGPIVQNQLQLAPAICADEKETNIGVFNRGTAP